MSARGSRQIHLPRSTSCHCRSASARVEGPRSSPALLLASTAMLYVHCRRRPVSNTPKVRSRIRDAIPLAKSAPKWGGAAPASCHMHHDG